MVSSKAKICLQQLEPENQILIVLDLDETLIHASERSIECENSFSFLDYTVFKRPYLDWFLESLSNDFKLAIWSSADDLYVQGIVDKIKPSAVEFEFVWGRSRCTKTRDYNLDEYVHAKRLKKVKKQGFPIEKILMIDDSPEKTKDNFGNAIYVQPFEGEQGDTELQELAHYLLSLKGCQNVRRIEKRGWNNKVG